MNEQEFRGLGLETEPDTSISFPEGLNVAYVNGTDSLDLPEDTEYQAPLSAWEEPLDLEEERKVWKETNPPSGYYYVQNFSGTEVTREAEFYVPVADGFELVKRPRTVTTYFGQGILEKDGQEWKTRIRLRVSPVRAYAKNQDGTVNPKKLDSAYKMFQLAVVEFPKIMGRDPQSLREIDDFLRTYAFKVSTFQLPNGELINTGLQGVRPE